MNKDVIIVGGGVAGLRCALELKGCGIKALVLEASDRVGGRIRTDQVDDFLLDHGFQVLLTAYDECQSALDYDRLQLGMFEPGALIWTGTSFTKLIDPWRRPAQAFKATFNSAASVMDKLRLGRLRSRLGKTTLESIYNAEQKSTFDYLKEMGFSDKFIEVFFRPFYSGIFLEPELSTSSAMFEFVFKMFGQGFAALPAKGMSALPEQIHEQLEPGTVRLNTPVASLNKREVVLTSGERISADEVVLATDMTSAAELTNKHSLDRGWNRTQCSYFIAPKSPFSEPIIALNGSGQGTITNIAVPSDVCSGYAANGRSLLCVSTSIELEENELRKELEAWFGAEAGKLKFLKSYSIPQALPRQHPGDNAFGSAPLRNEEGIWLCGDYRYSSSIQGAMASGRLVAQAITDSIGMG